MKTSKIGRPRVSLEKKLHQRSIRLTEKEWGRIDSLAFKIRMSQNWVLAALINLSIDELERRADILCTSALDPRAAPIRTTKAIDAMVDQQPVEA